MGKMKKSMSKIREEQMKKEGKMDIGKTKKKSMSKIRAEQMKKEAKMDIGKTEM